MLAITEAMRTAYIQKQIAPGMKIELYNSLSDASPFLVVSELNTDTEAFQLVECLSEGEDLQWGSCIASELKITLREIGGELQGKIVKLSHRIGTEFVPLGCFVIRAIGEKDRKSLLDITAYDYMSLFDTDVKEWYNGLTFPIKLKDFRASLCAYIGVTESVGTLPNDNMLITKTIDPAELIGRNVLVACEEINGVFGHFDRYGVLQHVALPVIQDNPSYSITVDDFRECGYKKYACAAIDKLQIRQESGDIGSIHGTGENAYIIEGNFLVYGKGAEELATITANVYPQIAGRPYRPINIIMKGMPFVETGDIVGVEADTGSIHTYLVKRTLTGLVALKDTCETRGNENRDVLRSINKEIIQLEGKYNVILKTVEEFSVTIGNLKEDTEASLSILSDSIALKVNVGEIASGLSLEEGKVYLYGDRLVVDSENISIDEEGNAEFSGLIRGAEIDIARGTNIGLRVLHDGTVRLGDFYVADEYGRQILQSVDNRTGMSPEPNEEGQLYLWAGYISPGEYAFLVNNRQQTHTKYLYCHDDDEFYQGRTVTDVLKELSEGIGGGARHRMTMEPIGLDLIPANAQLLDVTTTPVTRED